MRFRFRVILPLAGLVVWPCVALLAAASASAQPYRSVGPDGRVTYSDIPPTAASARDSGNGINSSGSTSATTLPYALAQVAQRYPVTLYTSQGCAPCDSGRSLLTGRGIPFTEKTVSSNNDIAALKKMTGNTSLPLLTIGSQQISGFQSSNWSQYLSAAGYPETNQLPDSYHRPSATPLAPPSPAEAATAAPVTTPEDTAAPAENTPAAPPPDPNNPAGIRF